MRTLRRVLTQAWKAVKIPVLVAGLIVAGAVTTSQVVLWRLAEEQESNLRLLTGAYLDGLSAAVLPPLVRTDARGVFDVIRRAQGGRYFGFEPRFAILQQPNGTIFASSDPRRFPPQSAIPDELREQFAADDDIVAIDADNGRAWLAKTLRTKGFSAGRLFAEVDIAASLRVHREILLAATLVILGLQLAITLGGYFAFRAVMPRLPTDEETDFLVELGEQRVELKAMTSRELLDFIDNKFEERFGRRLR